MPCYRPMSAWRSRYVSPTTGKRGITFSFKDAFSDLQLALPCGQCIGCRLEKSRQWAIRAVHEASLHDANCFLTLTYDNEHLPSSGSIEPNEAVLFMKRLRKRFSSERIRSYGCAEYGERHSRPHYHLCIFGFDFPDKVPWQQRGDYLLYRSSVLEDLWPLGFSTVGALNFETAAYVARYVTKKLNGPQAHASYVSSCPETGEVFERLPEQPVCVSRRPGIGRDWLELYKGDTYPSDTVVMRGKEMRPPSYYDRIFDIEQPDAFASVKRARRRDGILAAEKEALLQQDSKLDRLYIREKSTHNRLKQLRRSFENDT